MPANVPGYGSRVLHDLGGDGRPILLLHGLMGAGPTWAPVAGWLRRHGHVWAPDAAGHRGPGEAGPWTTERFVADAAAVLTALDDGPAVVWGHSMGGLHAWCLAAEHSALVSALVVEDMAADFRGRSAAGWPDWIAAWPLPFGDDDDVRAFFGPVAGEYFLRAFTRTDVGRVLHGDPSSWRSVAEHWGARDHWAPWEAVRCPVLLLEGEDGVVPSGQGAEMVRRGGDVTHVPVPGAGHLVHAQAPERVRGAVEAFLDPLPHPLPHPLP